MIFEVLKEYLWGTPTVLLISAAGAYFTAKTGLFSPKRLLEEIKLAFSALKGGQTGGVSALAAAATALGGTVGVGSIIGVGYGIAVGGAGSVFWMWVFSFLFTGLKHAEISVSLKGRVDRGGRIFGGAPFRLKELGFKKLSAAFCVCCIICSFGTGNAAQTGAISGFLFAGGAPPAAGALLCGGFVAFAVFGGNRRIAKLNSVLVPAASAVYTALCCAVIFANAGGVPGAFAEIFESAFGLGQAAGGFSGACLSAALREGCARSVFSNEAGMGSSPLAHSTSGAAPGALCALGTLEIVFDTFIVSTLTALCLLCTGSGTQAQAFSSLFGPAGENMLGALTAVFAFASVISWCYYSESCLFCLFGERKAPRIVYRILYSLAAGAGALTGAEKLLPAADVLNLFMTVPNMFLLYKCRREVN